MESKDKPHVILAQIVAVLGTFALAAIPKWFSIMTMTTVGTVGTCTGCIIYLPVLLVVDLAFFWTASRQKTASSRSRILALVAVANVILMGIGLSIIVDALGYLATHASLFTPRPENISWEEWLQLFVLFFVPEMLGVLFAVVALKRPRSHPERGTEELGGGAQATVQESEEITRV
jgi:hypothetical protein